MYEGTVVAMIDDFLGASIVLEHRLPEIGRPMLTVYGHTVVRETLLVGDAVGEGEVIGETAHGRKSKVLIDPHLHVSLALPLSLAAYDRLSWQDLNNPRFFAMMDPLDVIGGPYLVLDKTEEKPVVLDQK